MHRNTQLKLTIDLRRFSYGNVMILFSRIVFAIRRTVLTKNQAQKDNDHH
jgi:hypothetical protein